MTITTERVNLVHAILNVTRTRIIKNLLSKKTNISNLSKARNLNGIDRSTICYHLNILEDAGLVKSNYVILEAPRSKGRAGRVYEVDVEKLRKAIEAIDEYKAAFSPK